MEYFLKKLFIASVLILLCSQSAWAACVGPAQSAVTAAITAASNGDTIDVCAGSASWSGFTISKPISLIGAGMDNTIITITSYGYDGAITINAHATLHTRVAHMTMEGTGYYFGVNGAYNNTSRVRIDHIKASPVSGAGESPGFVTWNDNQPGLIDNCIIYMEGGCPELIHPFGDGAASWSRASNIGSADLLVVETNTFITGGGGCPSALTSFDGARWTFRYNTVIGAIIDAHPGAYPDTVFDHLWAGRQWEIYNNHWDSSIYALADLKGGTGVIYNNTSDHAKSIDIFAPTMEIAPCCCKSDLTTTECIQRAGFGQNRALDPLYFWGNTGMTLGIGNQDDNDPCNATCGASQGPEDALRENTEYYLSEYSYTALAYPHPLIAEMEGNSFPTLITPIDNDVSGWPVDFNWTAVDGAILYQIQVCTTADCSSPTIDDATIDPDTACDDTDCHYIVDYGEELAALTHYFWRVRALR